MLRALLIDRFKLRYHIDRSETDGYALTVARRDGRLGPALRASSVDCQTRLAALGKKGAVAPLPAGAAECGVRNGPGSIEFGGMPIDMLITMLSAQAGAPVVNQTGLSGAFDVKLRFALGSAGPPAPNAPPPLGGHRRRAVSLHRRAGAARPEARARQGAARSAGHRPHRATRPGLSGDASNIASALARSSCLTAFRRARGDEDESAAAMALRRNRNRYWARSITTTRARSQQRVIASHARVKRA